MQEAIRAAGSEGDSVGGVLETIVTGLPAGIGEPWFDSVESELAHLMFAVPACKGAGVRRRLCALPAMRGSEANDPFAMRDGQIATATNHNGGINGGITNGMPLVFRTVLKPTPSIYKAAAYRGLYCQAGRRCCRSRAATTPASCPGPRWCKTPWLPLACWTC